MQRTVSAAHHWLVADARTNTSGPTHAPLFTLALAASGPEAEAYICSSDAISVTRDRAAEKTNAAEEEACTPTIMADASTKNLLRHIH
jgi:hypothetical protein